MSYLLLFAVWREAKLPGSRPITLLNVDDKICARALAARLLKVIHHVNGPDQTCGVTGLGFGDSFIKWIRLPYTNPRCSVMVNGHLSPFFFPLRGVRQGCPLSLLLYVLNMEVLACNIRASPGVQVITLPEMSAPLPVLSLYEDDVSVITS